MSENNLLLSIDQAAFSSYFITEVTLPSWLRYIGPLAFSGTRVNDGIKLPEHCEGYVLDWFSNNNWIETYVIGSHAYAYTPRYTGDIKTFAINYHTNGGINEDINPTEYTVTSPVLLLVGAVKEGYDFDGWYAKSDFSGSIVNRIETGTYGDIDLWANYDHEWYGIVYHLDGGLNSDNNPDSYTIESNFELEEATKEGHVFQGWYNNSSFTGEPVTAITPGSINLIQLYAKFDIASAIDDVKQDVVRLSPNPARTHVVVHCHVQADVSIFDTSGKLMLQKQCSPSDNRISVSSLEPGIYLVKVNGVVKKLIKQ